MARSTSTAGGTQPGGLVAAMVAAASPIHSSAFAAAAVGGPVRLASVPAKVLIVGGVLNLAYGALLGYPITVIRAKGAPATPKYLMATHVSALLHAAVLLGLVWAARLSTLSPGWQDVAALLVVVSSALIAAKDTLNWLTGVRTSSVKRPRPRRWARSAH